MSFNVALSGLRAANQDLAVTGNNIANASTTGFKQSRAEFADVYAGSVLGTGSRTPGSGVLVSAIAQQFGQGNISITNNSLDFAISGEGFFVLKDQGAPVYTRAGIFGLDSQGYLVGNNSARLQGFQADVNGQILSGAPKDLRIETADIAPNPTTEVSLGFNLDSGDPTPPIGAGQAASVEGGTLPANSPDFSGAPVTFTISLTSPDGTVDDAVITLNDDYGDATNYPDGLVGAIQTQINANDGLPGRVTVSQNSVDNTLTITQDPSQSETLSVTGGFFDGTDPSTGVALDPSNPSSYNWSTAATVYDSLGNDHVLTTFYRKVSDSSNEWSVFAQLGNEDPMRLGHAQFDESGRLTGLTNVDGSARPGTGFGAGWDVGGGAAELQFAIELAGSTQHGSEFSINELDQNGYAPGRLAGLNINDSGIISARYTNGQEMTMGQVALANFSNPQGLSPVGNTMWAASFDSGQPVVGAPQTASLGAIQSGALEDSNVDLSDQLVNLIIAQRNYQANAKTIETANAVTQSIINLR